MGLLRFWLFQVSQYKPLAVPRKLRKRDPLAKVTPRHGNTMLSNALWVEWACVHSNALIAICGAHWVIHVNYGIPIRSLAAVIIAADIVLGFCGLCCVHCVLVWD
jgi:hypothetical protein